MLNVERPSYNYSRHVVTRVYINPINVILSNTFTLSHPLM